MSDRKYKSGDMVLIRFSYDDYKLGKVKGTTYSSYRVHIMECGSEWFGIEADLTLFIEPDVNNMVSI